MILEINLHTVLPIKFDINIVKYILLAASNNPEW
jgi:hypothetical protein